MVTKIAVMAVDTIRTPVLVVYRTVVCEAATMLRSGNSNLIIRCDAGAFGLRPSGARARQIGRFPAGVY